MKLLLVTLPFMLGILLKIVVFALSGRTQEAAFKRLDPDDKILSTGQKKVILAVVGLSTASLTAGSTILTSLVALLIVVLKSHKGWMWGCWALDLTLSLALWWFISSRKEPYQTLWGLKVGTFILLLSGTLDALGLVPAILTTR
jgi:ATP/ADP translocase